MKFDAKGSPSSKSKLFSNIVDREIITVTLMFLGYFDSTASGLYLRIPTDPKYDNVFRWYETFFDLENVKFVESPNNLKAYGANKRNTMNLTEIKKYFAEQRETNKAEYDTFINVIQHIVDNREDLLASYDDLTVSTIRLIVKGLDDEGLKFLLKIAKSEPVLPDLDEDN